MVTPQAQGSLTDGYSPSEKINLTEGYSSSELYMMEQFANQYAFGLPIGRAVSHAGYGTNSTVKGYELLQIPFVQHVINQTREWIRGRLADDINSLLMQLDQDRAFAYQMENPSAAVTATNSKAKLLGLLDPDKSNRLPAKITIEWDDSANSKDVTLLEHE